VTKVAVGDWPSATLEQICDIQLGKMLSPKSRIGLRPRPYLRNANVLWNRFDLSSMLEMDFAEEEKEKFGLRDGDVLVCEGGEPGRAAVWVNQIAPCFYQKALLRLRPHDRVVDPYFMMFRLWLGATTGEFTSDHAKTTIAHLPEVRLRALRIGVPSMAVQKQIVRLLTDGMAQADRARAAAEEQISLASCLAQALISEQFESAAVKGWPRRRLGSLAETCSGLTPNRGRPDYFGGQIPWVKTGELLDGTIFNTDEFVTEVAVRECGLRVLPPGTLLVAMYGQGKTRGRTGLLGCAATTNQACFAVLPNPVEFDSAFLQLWFRHKYQELRDLTEGRGGSQPNLNGEILRTLEVPLPALPEQLRVVRDTEAGLGHVVTVRRVVKEQMDSIAALPAALLRQAFRGEL